MNKNDNKLNQARACVSPVADVSEGAMPRNELGRTDSTNIEQAGKHCDSPAIVIRAAWLDSELFMRTGDGSCKHSRRLMGYD